MGGQDAERKKHLYKVQQVKAGEKVFLHRRRHLLGKKRNSSEQTSQKKKKEVDGLTRAGAPGGRKVAPQ